VVLSYEALIAAQAKRLTKKRERLMGWRDDWRADVARQAPDPSREATLVSVPLRKEIEIDWSPLKSVPATYADLYPPKYQVLERGEYTPHPPDLSHTEWADGYKEWAERKYDEIARDIIIARHLKPCFAENEI
jgi:hypothetical protein